MNISNINRTRFSNSFSIIVKALFILIIIVSFTGCIVVPASSNAPTTTYVPASNYNQSSNYTPSSTYVPPPTNNTPVNNNNEVNFQVFYDELSPYGNWVDYPRYGYVWVPYADAGFVPYSSRGHWLY